LFFCAWDSGVAAFSRASEILAAPANWGLEARFSRSNAQHVEAALRERLESEAIATGACRRWLAAEPPREIGGQRRSKRQL